jgi:anti-sigma-K factor RskA
MGAGWCRANPPDRPARPWNGRRDMTDDLRTRKHLRTRIQARRADIEEFLAHARPRRNVLNITSIVCSSLAAVFTAGPALGGAKAMNEVAKDLGLDGGSSVWRPLCVAAFIVALAAAVAANLNRSHDLPAQVAAAEACNGELESLLATLDFDELPLHEAVERYQKSIQKIPFVNERRSVPARRKVTLGERSAH